MGRGGGGGASKTNTGGLGAGEDSCEQSKDTKEDQAEIAALKAGRSRLLQDLGGVLAELRDVTENELHQHFAL